MGVASHDPNPLKTRLSEDAVILYGAVLSKKRINQSPIELTVIIASYVSLFLMCKDASIFVNNGATISVGPQLAAYRDALLILY